MKIIFRISLIIFFFTCLFNLTSCEKASEGLEYEYIKDGNYYRVIGIGTCLDEDIVIPKEYNGSRVMIIDVEAFKDCQTIKSVVIPGSVTTIREDAFNNCENLESVKIEKGVKVIGESAFSNCINLKSVKTEEGVETIGKRAFSYCKQLKEINLPSSITVIEKSTFSECVRLEKVELPNELTRIGHMAFHNCRSLKEIKIPENVTTIEGCVFMGCKNLVVYCDALECPVGWDSEWDYEVKEVLWKGQKLVDDFVVEYKKDDFNVKDIEGLSKEMYLEISMAYAKSNFAIEGLNIQKFYGEYNGAYVFLWDKPVITNEGVKELVIGSVEFPDIPDFMEVMVYKNGYVYTLKEAYDIRGSIKLKDLRMIKEQIELKGYINNGE